MSRQLNLVVPVYNEEECIVDVLRSWVAAFEALEIDFGAIILNDGSRDASWDRLQSFAGDPRFELVDKPNEGHGPTILRGYHAAVERGSWVFQCDSDDEMSPEHFGRLWAQRESHDAAFGYRQGRQQDPMRRGVTWVSRGTIRLLFGTKVRDVNTPYRLMRSVALGRILTAIPPETFAPNVLIAGAFSLGPWRVAEAPIPHRPRQTGSVSLFRWGLLKAAVRSFGQTLRFRFTGARELQKLAAPVPGSQAR